MNEITATTFDSTIGTETLIGLFAGFFLVFALFAVVGYVISSLIYMRLAQKAGQTSPWIAWIPFGYAIIGMKMRNKPWYYGLALLLLMPLAMMELNLLYYIGIIAWFIYLDIGILASFGKDKNLAFLHLIPGIGSLIVSIIIAVTAFGHAEYRDVY